jgi:hypothetical protein
MKYKIVKIFFLIQLLFFIYLLSLFTLNPVKLYLETPRAEFEPEQRTAAKDLVDTCNILYGDEIAGVEEQEGEFRRNLKLDTGQSFWLLLRDKVTEQSDLLRLARREFMPKDYQLFKEGMEDGLLNFFFDLGSFNDVWAANLSVAVQELANSYLLPWQRKIDFALISNLREQNTGGIYHLMLDKPFLPVIIPPTPSDEVRDLLGRPRNLLVLPKSGIVQVSPRVRLLTISFRREDETGYEVVLLVKIKGGIALICGVGEPGPRKILEAVSQETKTKILYYIGGTNMLIGHYSSAVHQELNYIHQRWPALTFIPNYNTSLQAQALCAEVFGPSHYRPGRLGSRIKLED